MSAAPATRATGYKTPNCDLDDVPWDWPYAHPKCHYPGYQDPALGWVPVNCACQCHTAEETP